MKLMLGSVPSLASAPRDPLLIRESNQKIVTELKAILNEQRAIVQDLSQAIQNGNSALATDLLGKLQLVGTSHAVRSRFNSIALGQIFYVIHNKWKNLPEEFKQGYSDYYDYIQQVYGYGEQMADMYDFVWRAWFSGKYPVEIPDFVNISSIPVVKLRVTAPYIVKGEMTEKRWKLLADETLTRGELTQMLKSGLLRMPKPLTIKEHKKTSRRCHLVRETGDLRMFVDGKPEILGFLNLKEITNPLVQTEIKRILIMADIRVVR